MRPEIKYKLIEKLINTEDEAILSQILEILELGSELSEAHKGILDERLSSHKGSPEEGSSWEDVKQRVKSKL